MTVAPSPRQTALTLGTLLLGTIGGVTAWQLGLPLAFMLGSMIIVTAAAIIGMNAHIPARPREIMVGVLGVMLGSGFTPAILDHLGRWSISLALLIPYVFLTGLVIAWGLERWTRMNRATAYFSAMPGGFNEMVMIGSAEGGDIRTLALVHASRIMLTVLILPLGFALAFGYGGSRLSVGLGPWPAWQDIAYLSGCLLLGMPAGRLLRLPAANLLGPLLLSAGIHLSGLTASSPPGLVIAIAQVVIGSAIGCRFTGASPGTVMRVIGLSVILTLVMLIFALGFASMAHIAADIDMATAILAYAPGGLAEMALVALYLGADTAFVAAHHLARIFVIILAAPSLYFVLKRRRQGKSGCTDDKGGSGMTP